MRMTQCAVEYNKFDYCDFLFQKKNFNSLKQIVNSHTNREFDKTLMCDVVKEIKWSPKAEKVKLTH